MAFLISSVSTLVFLQGPSGRLLEMAIIGIWLTSKRPAANSLSQAEVMIREGAFFP